MSDEAGRFEAHALTTFEVAAGGDSVAIELRDRTGKPATLDIGSDCLSSLLMTLPCMIEQALRKRHRDPTLRVVYPVDGWKLHLAGDGRSLILSLATPDRFEISFTLAPAVRREIAEALAAGEAEPGGLPAGVAIH